MIFHRTAHQSALLINVVVLWLTGLAVTSCTPATVMTGAFTHVDKLETELKRGVSRRIDVQRALGTPKGYGESILPTDRTAREVWYYGDIEVIDFKIEPGYFRAYMRQQVLLVFFVKDTFDGYMWFTNVGSGT